MKTYSADELATMFRVRQETIAHWCFLGRIEATKGECGNWQISEEEVERIRTTRSLRDV